MTLTIEIKPELQRELAAQAAAHGAAVEAYAARLIEEAIQPAPGRPLFDRERAKAAGASIRQLRKGLTLGGITIRQLIDEGGC